jgi:hypothetical protein
MRMPGDDHVDCLIDRLQGVELGNVQIRIGDGKPARIEPHRRNSRLSRPDDVGWPRIADHDGVLRLEREPLESNREDLLIRLREADIFRHDQGVHEWRQAALRHLLLLFGEKVVRDHRNADARAERGEQVVRAGDSLSRGDVGLTIQGRRRCGLICGGTGLDQQTAEALDARSIDVQRAGQHLQVQGFEVLGVRALEGLERRRQESRMRRVHPLQRGSRALMMVEQRVVEIEQHAAQRGPRPGGPAILAC